MGKKTGTQILFPARQGFHALGRLGGRETRYCTSTHSIFSGISGVVDVVAAAKTVTLTLAMQADDRKPKAQLDET